MPLVSVVVPVFDVEPYLRACLASIAQQTVGDLEVIVVDDGSRDASGEIAEEFARGDARFRVIRQANCGLGNARNNGADAAEGEFLAFVDGDDVLPRNAYELLLEALRKTGSDFATGNVHRLSERGATSQAPFLARTFAETRLATHVARFRPLLEDRIAPNKLWRRSFWDAQRFRFPEGMLHEDIPVVVPAQFAARSVDVVSDPVYLYRTREGADLSITQRRAEKRALLDRIRAIEQVLSWFDERGMRRARRWYERSIVAHDLRYYLNVLHIADAEYRALFLERVNALLDRAGRGLYGDLVAIDRLKWHLVRRKLEPELLEVLRFERERLHDTPPVRIRGRWYGDYPFRSDRRLRIPGSVYRLDRELSLAPRLQSLAFDGDVLRVQGHGYIGGIGAPAKGSQQVELSLVRPGRLRALRQRLAPVRMRTVAAESPAATALVRDSWCAAGWSGFEATLDAGRLRGMGRWDLHITVRAAGVTRRRARFAVDGTRAIRAAARRLPDGSLLRVYPGPGGQVTLTREAHWASITASAAAGEVAVLEGEIAPQQPDGVRLQLVGSGGAGAVEHPISLAGGARLRAEVPLTELAAAPDWDLYVLDGGGRRRLLMDAGAPETVLRAGGRDLLLRRAREGHALLGVRSPAFVCDSARWSGGDVLELSGRVHGSTAADRELVAVGRDHFEQHAFAIEVTGDRFSARLAAARVPSLAGELPLRAGEWDLCLKAAGGEELEPLLVAQSLYPDLPLVGEAGHKHFALGMTPRQGAQLAVGPDLDLAEQGRFHQRELRDRTYAGARREPLRDAVLYASFGGAQCSDSPLAIQRELTRLGAPLEHLWLVRDAMCAVPPGASPVREASREHYEALARSRYLVVNDELPDWFEPRADQICLQTWHGTPLIARPDRPARREWSYTLSANRASTPILQEADLVSGELLETGLPRADALVRSERMGVRRRLGLADGDRAVLYAPTYRDEVVDGRGRHRLDVHLDLDRLRASLDPDTVILFRRHQRVADAVPASDDGFVRDVSAYPDATELLLAAEVLVTDYSSIAFEFANTGRPMVFFAYDLDAMRPRLRLDYEATMPGPIVQTGEELAAALAGTGDRLPEHEDRYKRFAQRFCELDDGNASRRVVERVFSW